MKLPMKSLIGSLVFSQCLLNSSFAAISDDSSAISIEEEMQKQQLKTAEKVAQIAHRILSTPEEQKTYENTLGLWQSFIEQISSNADGMTTQGMGTAFLAGMQCSTELYLALKRNALSILSEESFNVFQKHIARCFLDNCEQKEEQNLLHLYGCAEEKNITQNGFTITNLDADAIGKDQIGELAKQILDSNADVMCLREISAEDSPSLFEALKNEYAHIYFVANVCGKEFFSSKPWIKGSVFIASKYALESINMRSQQYSTENNLLNFVIKEFRALAGRSNKDRDRDSRDEDRKSGGSCEVGIEIHYGGSEGTQYDGYVKAEGHDNQGNYVEGRLDHNFNSGEGTSSFRGGSEREQD